MAGMLLARIPLLCLLATALLPAQSVDLLPGESLKGWTRIPIPATDGLKPKLQWRVDSAQKTLICTGDGQHEWLRSDQVFGDYLLEVDFRFTPKGPDVKYNSGIGIRLSPWGELWTQAQTGPTGGYLFGVNLVEGALKGFNLMKEMKENRIKPAGEWNHYEIRVQGDKVTLSVNGAAVSEIPGLALRKGHVGFEGEGHEIAFRNIKLTVLP
jgi:Domain of Unknown Function (DUF1080)